MRNIGSKIFGLLIVALVVAGMVYAFLPEPIDVDLATVGRGDVRVTVDEDGKTRIHDKYIVSAPLVGRLLRIDLDPGDLVEAGKTLLATIEPRDPDLLDARSVAQAEASVKAAEAAVKKMEPQMEELRHGQAYAEAEMTRARKAGASAISQAELENTEFLFRQKSELLRSMRIQEEIAQFELEQARAALLRTRPNRETKNQPSAGISADLRATDAESVDNTSDDNGDDNGSWTFPIFSPIDGRVLRVLQESAAVVTAGTPLLELGDCKDLEVEVDVLSRDAVKIHPGAPVFFEHWGGDQPLNGRVRLVEPSGFTKISTLGVEEQRVWVIVDLVDPPKARGSLADGFRVEARIVIDEAKGVLKVPTSALFRIGAKSAVFRVVDGVVHQQFVTTGRQNGLDAEIVDGLAEGDRVIINPSDKVEGGVKIRAR